jgi:hypothetical protein
LAFPDIKIQADLTTPPLIIPTNWTDWSPRLRNGLFIHQGRQRTLSRTETGTMRAPLDNQDRGLDPTVTANLKPLNHVKVEAVSNGSTFPLFRGFVRSYPQDWPARKDAVSTIECEDAFSLMARYELEGQAIAEMSAGDHIEAVLTAFGWPAAGTIPPGSNWWQLGHAGSALGTNTFLGASLRFLDEGRSTIMALSATGNMLEHLLNVAENTDRGTLYVGPSGDIVFKQKPSPHAPVLGVWGDGAGEYDYFDFSINFDDVQWFNDVRVNRRGDATEHTVKDQASIDNGDGPRTLSVTDTLFSTSGAASNLANELLGTFDDPVIYPIRLVMRPKDDSTIWPLILGMPLMTKITVHRRPPGVGDMVSLDCYVIGITYNIGQFWEITWDLAAAETLLDAWYLGTPGFSELGVTTKLG